VPGEHELGAGIGEIERDLAALEQHVHRHDHTARAQHAVVRRREVRDVGQHDPHPVAGGQPLGLKHRRNAGTCLVELGIGDLDLVELQRDPVTVLRCGVGED